MWIHMGAVCMPVCCENLRHDWPTGAVWKRAAGGCRLLSGRACSISGCCSCVLTLRACLSSMCPRAQGVYTPLRATRG